MKAPRRTANHAGWGWRWAVSVVLLVAACFLAAVLWRLDLPFTGHTWKERKLFELFGFAQTLALAGIAALFIPLCRKEPDRYIPLVAFLCLGLYYLTVFQSISTPTLDYRC